MRGAFAIFILLIMIVCGIATILLMLRLFGVL
ncbi:MAG: hypothetical protein FD165_2506 [Gammaproteobacteria bacterium]|nr:MAG: hypothetical protein FD165_2506 [Gammaproteobacteria bacterium]TND02907.1 MAG: hypothetical protein FD120_1976 [Gammaproteobacteria bacterium]